MVPLAARLVGGREVAIRLRGAAASADLETRDAVREAAEQSVFVFRAKAPRRTGRLQRGIKATVRGSTAQVEAHARSREGFDYVGVTRFGHRVRVIHAKRGEALRFVVGRRVLFRKSVRGYRPKRDWSRAALPAAERLVEAAGRRAGERIVARVSA